MSGKKLLNTVERCVDENLEGLVAINPGMRILKDTRVVVRADIEEVKKQGKVTILCGGGSGHEPAHAGMYLITGYNLYHLTKMLTCPNCKHLQTTIKMRLK